MTKLNIASHRTHSGVSNAHARHQLARPPACPAARFLCGVAGGGVKGNLASRWLPVLEVFAKLVQAKTRLLRVGWTWSGEGLCPESVREKAVRGRDFSLQARGKTENEKNNTRYKCTR